MPTVGRTVGQTHRQRAGLIQERYGIAKDEADKQMSAYL
jgi:uncharacterized protein YjbJ (UPF0337 family)